MAYNSLLTYTSHFMLLWGEVSWNPLAPVPVKTWLEQYSAPPLCGGSERVLLLNEAASQTKNVVMQSVTVVDGQSGSPSADEGRSRTLKRRKGIIVKRRNTEDHKDGECDR